MTVKEAGEGASLVTTVLIYGVFTAAVTSGTVAGSDQIGLLILLVVAQIVAMVVFHIVMAIRRGTDPKDERARLIELHSFRTAYLVLAFGVASVTIAYVAWGGIA